MMRKNLVNAEGDAPATLVAHGIYHSGRKAIVTIAALCVQQSPKPESMILIVSLASLVSGAAVATIAAARDPAHAAMLERGAGALMVAGLTLLGSLLPFVP